MTVVAERFVRRQPTATERDACVFEQRLLVGRHECNIAAQVERPVSRDSNGVFFGNRFVLTIVRLFEVQRSGRTLGNHRRYRLGWGVVGIEYLRRAVNALPGVNSSVHVVTDLDLLAGILVDVLFHRVGLVRPQQCQRS